MTIKIDYKEDSEIIQDLEEIIAGANNIFVMPEIMKQVEGVLKTVSNRAGREDLSQSLLCFHCKICSTILLTRIVKYCLQGLVKQIST